MARHSIKKLLVLLAALVFAGFLGACGGGGDSSSTTVTTSSLSKGEFLRRANTICAKSGGEGLAEARVYAKEKGGGSINATLEAFSEGLRRMLMPKIQAEIVQIRSLGAPKGDVEQVEAVLGAMQAGVNAGREGSGTLPLGQTFERADKLARSYGLEACVYS